PQVGRGARAALGLRPLLRAAPGLRVPARPEDRHRRAEEPGRRPQICEAAEGDAEALRGAARSVRGPLLAGEVSRMASAEEEASRRSEVTDNGVRRWPLLSGQLG